MSEKVDLPVIALPAGAYDFDAVNEAAAAVLKGRAMTPELAEEVIAAVQQIAVPAVAPSSLLAEAGEQAMDRAEAPEGAGAAAEPKKRATRRDAATDGAAVTETSGTAAQQE